MDNESFLQKRKILGNIYSFFVVNFLWVIFRASNMSQALGYISVMFHFEKMNTSLGQTMVYLKENIVFFIMACFLAFGFLKNVSSIQLGEDCKLLHSNNVITVRCISVLCDLLLLFVFALSIIYVINGTYNPFIYFNF